MEFTDRTGQPRSDEELKEAVRSVEECIVHHITKTPPILAVYLSVIRDALVELIKRRSDDS